MMETVGVAKQQPYSPHLKKVLKTYQLSAVKSLQGPSTLLGMDKGVVVPATASANSAGTTTVTLVPKKEHHPLAESVKVVGVSPPPAPQPPPPPPPECADVFMTPPPFPIQQLPILTTPDQSRSELSETVLEGETISCFVVGGEKRLCLPQVLNSVLREFSLYQINQVCEELQIFCSRCNPEQLQVLKASGILPMTAPSCGLITKTDAERLSSALLHHRNAVVAPVVKASHAKTGAFSFKVYHECFGKCKGICTPELYTDKNAHCIECMECHVMFSPQKFVCHVHRFRETRTCHWGFDSNNWRSYLLIAKDQEGHEKLAKVLDEFKEQHDNVGAQHKRKQAHNPDPDAKDSPDAQKKPKLEGGDPYGTYIYPVAENSPILWYEPWARMSAFRPWSTMLTTKEGKVPSQPVPVLRESSLPPTTVPAYLSHSPPVLLHPERVIPMSETERFERSFQPNVALAPIHPPHRSRLETTKTEVKTEDLRIEEEEEKPLCSKKSPTLVPESVTEAHHVTACSPPGSTATHPLQEPQHCTVNYNPEIELSTDTDDSSSDIIGETGDSVVEQVVEVLDGLTDAKEVTRARIVELVQRLARKLEEGSLRARHMHSENADLQRVCREQERRIREQEERIMELERRLQQDHESPVKQDPDAFQDKVAAMEKELHILRNEVAGMPCSSLGHRIKEPSRNSSGGSPVSVITSPPPSVQPVIKMEPTSSE